MSFKKRIILFLIIIVTCTVDQYANTFIDSLKTELQKELPDTSRVLLLSQLSFAYKHQNIDSGLTIGKKAYELAERIKYRKGKQYSLNSIANNYLNKSEPDSALIHFNRLLEIISNDEKLLLGITYDNMGLCYQQFSDYPSALENHYKAIQYFKEANYYGRILSVSHNMGLIYTKQKEYLKAKNHYLSLLRTAEKNKENERFGRIYKSLTGSYLSLNQIDSAEIYAYKSLEFDKENSSKHSIAISIGNIANINFIKKEYLKAIKNYKKAIKLETEVGNKEGIARNYANFGELYLERYKETKDLKFFNLSKSYLIKSKNIYESYGEKSVRIAVLKLLADLHENNNNYQEAYNYLNEFTIVNDSLLGVQTSESMRNLEIKRDQKLREKELELLKKENDYNLKLNSFLITLSILVVVILIIAFNLYRTKNKQNENLEIGIKQRTEDLELAKKDLYDSLSSERELSEMKSNFITTISHEFRTPLTAISTTAMVIQHAAKDVKGINNYIETISECVKNLDLLIDNILNYSTKDASLINWVPQDVNINEFAKELVEWSKKLEKEPAKVYYTTEITNTTIRTDRKLLEKALHPILRNAMKYTDPSKEVKLLFKEEASNWMIFIKDQGSGIEADDLKNVFEPFFKGKKDIGINSGTGLGLAIAKKYIEILNGKISIESKLNMGTIITIIIPKI